MCDSYYLPAGDSIFFGKNSDRNAAEPQAFRIVPRREPSASVRFGDRSFDLPDAGHALALSCPTWMTGAEMGVNGAGVAIGNEAVFSRLKAAPDGVLGMDILRAALASASTAEAALEAIVLLTEKYDQGGNAAFKGTMTYSNSYLIAGPDGAYVLETAAKRWAWRKAEGPTALSNAYSILDDYKRVDAATRKAIAPVNDRMACLDEADAGRLGEKGSWKPYVENRLMSFFSAGESRQRAVSALLEKAAVAGGKAAALAVLREHAAPDPLKPSKTRRVCDHDSDIMGNPTTASMLVEYAPGSARTVLWFTGASYACANLFKPIVLENGEFTPLWTDYDYDEGSGGGEAYWHDRRAAAKRIWRNPAAANDNSAALVEAQGLLFEAVDGLGPRPTKAGMAAASARVSAIVAAWDARAI